MYLCFVLDPTTNVPVLMFETKDRRLMNWYEDQVIKTKLEYFIKYEECENV